MAKGTTAVYLYCLVRAARRPAVARVPSGLPGGTRPQAHRAARSLWVIASEAPLDVYGPAQLEPQLRGLEWGASIAVAHEGVVEHFARSRGATTLPMKLFTMFSSLDKALDDITGRSAAIARVMRRISGCEEWGIRIARTAAGAEAAPAGNGGAPRTGTAFLAARKQARDSAAATRAAAAERASEAYERLRRRAKAARRRDRGAEPGSTPPILEAAFLVPAGKRTAFKAEARRQAAAVGGAGAELTLTGPWPAYNFVAGDEDRP